MQQLISTREANQHLSQYIEAILKGDEVRITRRGVPVARLTPYVSKKELDSKKIAARKRTHARMKKGFHLGNEKIVRDSLHER